jgi:hypothetical protein
VEDNQLKHNPVVFLYYPRISLWTKKIVQTIRLKMHKPTKHAGTQNHPPLQTHWWHGKPFQLIHGKKQGEVDPKKGLSLFV